MGRSHLAALVAIVLVLTLPRAGGTHTVSWVCDLGSVRLVVET
jgi:hypothetical protein